MKSKNPLLQVSSVKIASELEFINEQDGIGFTSSCQTVHLQLPNGNIFRVIPALHSSGE